MSKNCNHTHSHYYADCSLSLTGLSLFKIPPACCYNSLVASADCSQIFLFLKSLLLTLTLTLTLRWHISENSISHSNLLTVFICIFSILYTYLLSTLFLLCVSVCVQDSQGLHSQLHSSSILSAAEVYSELDSMHPAAQEEPADLLSREIGFCTK